MTVEALRNIVVETLDSLERIPGAAVLVPSDVPLDHLCMQLEQALPHRYSYEAVFSVAAEQALAQDPGALLADLLGRPEQPVQVPGDLHEDEHAVVVVNGTPGSEEELDAQLRQWSEHFRRFKPRMDRGGGIRCIWVGHLVPQVMRRSRSLPEHWATVTWTEPRPDDLEKFARHELSGCMAPLSRLGREFLMARLLDLAGGRLFDLELAVNIVKQVRSTGSWLDRISWDACPPPDRVVQALATLEHSQAFRRLLRFGGVVVRHLVQDWDNSGGSWEDDLWGHGIWSEYGDLVGLSPLALHECHSRGLLSSIASPPSQTALRLLGRSLYWERLLKDRLVMAMADARLQARVEREVAILPPGNGKTQAPVSEQVHHLTLGRFLALLGRVLPGGPETWDFRDFSQSRNVIAHGGKATWQGHWAKVEVAEKVLLHAYTVLAGEHLVDT